MEISGFFAFFSSHVGVLGERENGCVAPGKEGQHNIKSFKSPTWSSVRAEGSVSKGSFSHLKVESFLDSESQFSGRPGPANMRCISCQTLKNLLRHDLPGFPI